MTCKTHFNAFWTTHFHLLLMIEVKHQKWYDVFITIGQQRCQFLQVVLTFSFIANDWTKESEVIYRFCNDNGIVVDLSKSFQQDTFIYCKRIIFITVRLFLSWFVKHISTHFEQDTHLLLMIELKNQKWYDVFVTITASLSICPSRFNKTLSFITKESFSYWFVCFVVDL